MLHKHLWVTIFWSPGGNIWLFLAVLFWVGGTCDTRAVYLIVGVVPSDFSLLFGFAAKFEVVATFYCTWILEGLKWVKSQPTLNTMSSSCCSTTQPCPILCDPVDCSTPDFPVLQHLPELLKLMSIGSEIPSNHLIFCCPLLLLSSIFPSIRVFSNESTLHIRWPK